MARIFRSQGRSIGRPLALLLALLFVVTNARAMAQLYDQRGLELPDGHRYWPEVGREKECISLRLPLEEMREFEQRARETIEKGRELTPREKEMVDRMRRALNALRSPRGLPVGTTGVLGVSFRERPGAR
jgi:hypothetical protein